jgi:hypothetical protein
MRTIVLFSVVLITSACAADKPTKSATLAATHTTRLCRRISNYLRFHPVASFAFITLVRKAFRDAPRNQTDWAAYLRAQGVIFPRGGFAAYYAPSATLIVATHRKLASVT